ncbi:MAG: adenosylcobinamide-GDP ribazoletransferase [Mangrovibacterium sp.]
MFRRELNIIGSAFLYFSRLPMPFKVEYKKENQAFILTWFPLVGIVVGAIGGLAYFAFSFFLPHLPSIILALGAMILATGAFHEDGWADVCDAFGGGYSTEQKLTIMKDSRVGAYAAIGIFFLLALKISLLYSIKAVEIPLVLIVAHALSRFPLLLLSKFWHNARSENSKSKDSSAPLSWGRISLAFMLAILPLLFFEPIVFAVIPLVIISSLLAGRYFNKHLGGYTGDCLGMAQQVNELLIFAFFCAMDYNIA